MEKDWIKSRMAKIGNSESFQTTLVGKDGEKSEMAKIGHSESFWTTCGKRLEKVGNSPNCHLKLKIGCWGTAALYKSK